MRVRMNIKIEGTRNGLRWPAPGGEVDLTDGEAADLCSLGFAEPVVVEKVEKRPAKKAEKRA